MSWARRWSHSLVSWDEVVIALFQTGFDKTLPVLIFSYLSSGADPTIFAAGGLIILLLLAAAGLASSARVLSGGVTTLRPGPDSYSERTGEPHLERGMNA